MIKSSPLAPTVELSIGACWVRFCQWPFIELRLYGIHCHSHMFQLCNYWSVGTGKDWIGLWQSFQSVTMRLNSLDYSVQVFYCLMMLFCWGWWYTIDVIYLRYVSPFACSGDYSPLLTMGLVGKFLIPAHLLKSVVCCLHSRISLLNVAVCAKRFIPLDTIVTSEIVCPSARVNSLPLSNCPIKRARGSAVSYGPIVFTAFSSRLISSITL